MAIRILIADDHEVIRRGLITLLRDSPYEVIGEATTGPEAVEQARQLQPDVILLDVRMPELDGLEALDQIHSALPRTRVVMLSNFDNPTYIARAIALGAFDYVLKSNSIPQLLAAVQRAAEDRPSDNGTLINGIAASLKKRPIPSRYEPSLTRREHQVLRHLAFGLSNREIGRSLHISIETVKEHVQNVLRKLQVSDRTEAAVWAVRKQVV